jgi:hypothetical protein
VPPLPLGNWSPGARHRSRQKRDIHRNPVDRNLSLRNDLGLESNAKIGDHAIDTGGSVARVAGFAYLSRFNQSGGERTRSLYWPVALSAAADLGGSPAGIGVVSTFRSTDAQT